MSLNYASDRQRESFERAHREHDKVLAAGPPEPPTADVTVEYTVWIDREETTLPELTKAVGGEAAFASGRENGWIEVKGSTLVEDVESVEEAKDVLRALLDSMGDTVDMDTLITSPQDPFEVDEPDWDAIEKDRRIEREGTR